MANQMEKIILNGKLVAIKISSMGAGSVPVTAQEEVLQVLTLKHPKGRIVSPHSHTPKRRETTVLQECLVVIRGKLRVSLCDESGTALKRIDISAGETCIILSGVHGVEFLEDSEVIEIKNGPYIDDKKNAA